MLKRILYITFVASLIGALVYFYIQVNQHSEVKTSTDLLEVLPNNPGIIIEIPQLNEFTSQEEKRSALWESLGQLQALEDYTRYYQQWDSLAQQEDNLASWDKSAAIVSYHLLGQKINSFFALKLNTKASEKAWNTILTSQLLITKKYNGISIYSTQGHDKQYAIGFKGFAAISNNPILLEQSIRHLQNPQKKDPSLVALRQTKGDECLANVFVNYEKLQAIVESLSHPKSPLSHHLKHIGQWGELDLSINNKQLIMNGFSSYSKDDYWQIFADQSNSKLSILDAIPSSSEGFFVLSPSDLNLFRTNYEDYLQNTSQLVEYNSYWASINKRGVADFTSKIDALSKHEIALCFNTMSENIVILKTHSHSQTQEQITDILTAYHHHKNQKLSDFTSRISIDNETSFTCYQYPFKDSFKYLYGKAFDGFEANYLAQYQDYLIFASKKEGLKAALKANILKQSYANDKTFQNIYKSFASKSSLFYFEKVASILPKLQNFTSPAFCQNNKITEEHLQHFYALTYQMVSSGKYAYNSILCQYNAELKTKPTTEWSSQLDAAPIGKPTLVKNHYTKENEICIQDALNNLYLISNSGRIIWKKAIGEEIISDIHQIDYYKNGKFQLLFNTPNKLWLLDRDGNFVERYPILLSSPATTGLSLFDYDKHRDYRIFVPTQDKKIRLFNKDGNINKGFEFKGTEEHVSSPLQFFRVAGKDYIVLSDKNRVYILNRRGQERIKLKQQFAASNNNQFYLGKDERQYLATTDDQGALRKIYFDGSISTLALENATSKHYFALEKIDQSNNDNFIIVDEDKIKVYNFRGRLLYTKQFENAILSRPYFYRFSKQDIKLGITDLLNNEIHLLNGQDGSLYDGFPLIGTTPFTIGFLKTSNWRFSLIVGGENNALYNYKVK